MSSQSPVSLPTPTAFGNCSLLGSSTPSGQPSKIPWVAVPNYQTCPSILASCCGGNPVAEWDTLDPAKKNCYVYCNVTAPGQTYQSVSSCFGDAQREKKQDCGVWTQGAGRSSDASQFGKGGVMGFVVMGVAFVGCVWGML